jgi:hypothetical protein
MNVGEKMKRVFENMQRAKAEREERERQIKLEKLKDFETGIGGLLVAAVARHESTGFKLHDWDTGTDRELYARLCETWPEVRGVALQHGVDIKRAIEETRDLNMVDFFTIKVLP